MTVKDLIHKLEQTDGNKTVTIEGYNFTGVGFDDNNGVELYIAGGDIAY